MIRTTLLGLVFCAVAVVSCGRNGSEYLSLAEKEGPLVVAPAIPNGLGLVPYQVAVTDVFVTESQKPVDLLISADTSLTMADVIPRFTAQLGSIVSRLKARNLDFRAGVLRATNLPGGSNQVDSSLQGPSPLVSSADADPAGALKANIDFVNLDGQGEEFPIYVIWRALQDQRNVGSFRPQATDFYLVLTDGEDPRYVAGNQSSINTAIADYRSFFNDFSPGVGWTMTTLGVPSANPCTGTEVTSQPLIEPLTLKSGGSLGRVCDTDLTVFAAALTQDILSAATSRVITGALPSNRKVDVLSMELKLDGVSVPNDRATGFGWNEARHAIAFPGTTQPTVGQTAEVYLEYIVP